MLLGYIRDRIALIFTILIPVLFLVLLGSIYRGPATPKINVLEVGRVSMLDQARAASPGQLGEVMAVTRSQQSGSRPGRRAQGHRRRGGSAAGHPPHRALLGR
jgi:ABC-2 type transport system permease protein